MSKLRREEAVSLIAGEDLKKLSKKERKEQLELMLFGEDWSNERDWSEIPKELIRKFVGKPWRSIEDYEESKYDPILLMAMKNNYSLATNKYILKLVKFLYPQASSIDGKAEAGFPCPCCGYNTLASLGDYDICAICWWEDDSQDNHNAHLALGGPNRVSLLSARLNFLNTGISDPTRTDLVELQEPKEKYTQSRFFTFNAAEETLAEGTIWKASMHSTK